MRRRREHRASSRTPKAVKSGRVRQSFGVLALAVVALVSAALVGGLLFHNAASDGGAPSGPKTAAIVDQLSLSFPNSSFVETATRVLEQAGYIVDYYPGEEVTVEFYRNLPTHGYDMILMRVHSGLARDDGKSTDYVSLFTGEPFSDTFSDERNYDDAEAGRLARARQFEGGPEYFAIVPDFIESSMRGVFDDTTIILMGCDGLKTPAAAETFVRKGVKAVVGWSDSVSASHTDAATERLLQHLLVDEIPTAQAVAQTMAEVGPDPEYESTLLTYPSGG